MKIKGMPKILLHIHLDGSVRLDTIKELLNNNDIVNNKLLMNKHCQNLNDYLAKFELPIKVMQTKENLLRISEEVALDLKKDNVIYAEIRFAPFFHIKQGLTLDEVIETILEGLKKVSLKTNLILCMMRGMKKEDNLKVINLAIKYRNKGVCGIDLAGAENSYKTKDYEDLFKYASDNNVNFTIHAGEADGIESINSALKFNTKRIGHGIRSIDSQDTIDKLISKKVTLEVCPTSNVDTCIVDVYKNHPIKKLYDKNILITINTDNNTVSNISLTEEYKKIVKYFAFTQKDLYKINLNAINCAFISIEEKDELIEKMKQYR
ncbi:MAG: adenosine deaminase [Bacilli bacterium]